MVNETVTSANDMEPLRAYQGNSLIESSQFSSGVSWAAIFAGAAGTAALSLILLILGTGLGMSSISPWSGSGISGVTFGVATILWLTLTQLVASATGGYLAGRLRTKWAGVHTDEVYFRDTAHGFLSWAVAALVTAVLLTSVVSSLVGTGVKAGAASAGAVVSATAAGAGAAATAAGQRGNSETTGNPMTYVIDTLFRKDPGAPTAGDSQTQATSIGETKSEVGRILMNSVATGQLSPQDSRYVAQLVAQRTGLSQEDAEKRVSELYKAAQQKIQEAQTAAKEAADKARQATAYASLWLFVSLLIGAFAASLAATFGGRRRDL